MSMFFADAPEMQTLSAPFPWRRYFARKFDFALYGLLWSLAAQWGRPVNIGGLYAMLNVLSIMVGVVLMVVIEPFLRISGEQRPESGCSAWRYARRTAKSSPSVPAFTARGRCSPGAWAGLFPSGAGTGCIRAIRRSRQGEPPWDIDNGCHIVMHERKTKWYRVLAFLFAWLLVLAAEVGISLYADLPRNTGRLTLHSMWITAIMC